MKVGDKVIFNGELKSLDKGTVGVLTSLKEKYAVITYEQNKGTNKVYSHSCSPKDLTK